VSAKYDRNVQQKMTQISQQRKTRHDINVIKTSLFAINGDAILWVIQVWKKCNTVSWF